MIPPTTPVPTTLKSLTVTLKDWLAGDGQDAGQSAGYSLVLLDQDGRRLRWSHEQGNLVPHITVEQREWLMSFMASLRMQVKARIIED